MEAANDLMDRTEILPNRGALAMLGVLSGASCLFWLFVGFAAAYIGDICYWLIFPSALLLAFLSAAVCLWSLRRRASEEPALVIDHLGLYDNITPERAGRVRWTDTERVWLIGSSTFEMLCVLPENLREYLAKQDEPSGLLMRLNVALTGAPIVLPLFALQARRSDVWDEILQYTGKGDRPESTSHWAHGA